MTTTPTRGGASLVAPLPNIQKLSSSLPLMHNPSYEVADKIEWCRDVLFLHNREVGGSFDPELRKLATIAASTIQQLSTSRSQAPPEAVYLLATLESSGSLPEQVPHSPRNAFRDYEAAARGGYHIAWFNLGRDYENFDNHGKARECFERGIKQGDAPNCLYRMGMAHLLGQLGLPASQEAAMTLLYQAANVATIDNPQPAYVFALILLGEFSAASIDESIISPYIPVDSSRLLEARLHLERAGYLHFAPAQYKLGHVHEFAQEPFPFDPVLSVEWYNAAALQGEAEAEMALSKWFLVGAEGCFDKDEDMSLVFAQKAAAKELPAAEFAMGYYSEVGIGGLPIDQEAARAWYIKAHDHGAPEAAERLKALNQSIPQTMGREEHATVIEDKLVRKQTLAKAQSMARRDKAPRQRAEGRATSPIAEVEEESPSVKRETGDRVVKHIRKATIDEGSGTRAFANLNRYTLTDPGSASVSQPTFSSEGSQESSPRPGMAPRYESGSAIPQAAPPAAQPHAQAKRPTTFADMGIPTVQVANKKEDCVIM